MGPRWLAALPPLVALGAGCIRPTSAPQVQHPVATAPVEAAPALLTQVALDEASCRGVHGEWRCASPEPPHRFAAGRTPIIPTSWGVLAWSVDETNASGCASNTNNCTTMTCGAAGSGIGPCADIDEIVYGRWGCNGNPKRCPRIIGHTTTITGNWGATDNSHPMALRPSIEGLGSRLTVNAANATVVATVTTASYTARNRNTPQLMQHNLGASAASGQQIVNTSQGSSRAWVIANVSGNVWSESEPFFVWNPANGSCAFEYQGVGGFWGNGQTATLNTYPPINISALEPEVDTNDSSGGTGLFVDGVTFYSPTNLGSPAAFLRLSAGVSITNSLITRSVIADVNPSAGTIRLYNDYLSKGIRTNVIAFSELHGVTILGGVIDSTSFESFVSGVGLDGDVVLIGGEFVGTNADISLVYASSAFNLFGDYTTLRPGCTGAVGINDAIWGPGQTIIRGTRFFYNSADTAANQFLTTFALGQANGTTAVAFDPTTGIWSSAIPLNVANLDKTRAQGGFQGIAHAVNGIGRYISNSGP